MHIGPSSNANGVYVVCLHEFQPVVVDRGYFILASDCFSGLAAAVGHGYYLDTLLLSESWYVSEACICTGTNEPNADGPIFHDFPPGADFSAMSELRLMFLI